MGGRSQAELGEPSDERAGLVVVAPAESDLVEDRPVAHDEHAIGVGRGPCVVSHEHDRLPQPVARVPQQVEDLGAGRVVEVAGRLVGQQDGGLGGKRPRQRNALLLAGGELVGVLCALAEQADEVEQRGDRVAMRGERLPGDEERERDVLADAEQRDEVEVLEDEPGLLAPGQGARPPRRGR